MQRKISLGYYMFTPMLGGAETYLRDLLWRVNRERFDVTLYYEPWSDFEAFLGLNKCPALRTWPVRVIELSGHTRISKDIKPNGNEQRLHSPIPEEGLARIRRLYRHAPFRQYLSPLVSMSARYLFWKPNKIKLTTALSARKLDILHVVNGGYPGASSAQAAAIVARQIGISACLMTVCSTAAPQTFPRVVERRIDRMVNDSVTKFIVPGDRPGQALTDNRGFNAMKLHKIYWGVEAPALSGVDARSAANARNTLGIPSNARVIGTVASFTPLKGQIALVDAVAILRTRIPNLRAVLVGDGPSRAEVEKRAVSQGVDDLTIFTGFYDDVFQALQAFDVFVLPSELEGLPYAVLEAMSQGKPVVATDVGGVPEAILSGRTGFIIPLRDSAVLAEKIACILENPTLAHEMGRAAYAHYRANFTLEHMIRQHELLYEMTVER